MNKAIHWLRHNAGASVFALNVVLVILLYFQYNPLNLIATGYEGARPLLDSRQEDVSAIRVLDPDLGEEVKVSLVRGDQLPAEEWQKPEAEDEPAIRRWLGKVIRRDRPEYGWNLVVERAGKETQYQADPDRVRDLFSALQEARRYYGIDRSPERDRDLEMGKDSRGRYANLRLEILDDGGRQHTLFVGRSAGGGAQNFVRLNEEDVIYQVETNLRSVLGGGDPLYFRDRRILPAEWKREDLVGIELQTADQAIAVNSDGVNWRMPALPGVTVKAEEMNLIAGDLIAWRATSFPETAPDDLDRRFAGTLNVQLVKKRGNETLREDRLSFEILGRRNFSSYVLLLKEGGLVEVNSIYLEDLYDPARKLVDASAAAPGVGP